MKIEFHKRSGFVRKLAYLLLVPLSMYAIDAAVSAYNGVASGPKSAWAGEKETGEKLGEYKTVDDILQGTPFVKIDIDNVQSDVKKYENVVLLFYNSKDVESYNGRLAKVFKEVAKNYPDLTYLKLKHSDDVSDNSYIALGLKGTPAFAYYKNGKRVCLVNKGPPKRKIDHWIKITKDAFKKYFY
jgi:hypothetical protein